MRAAKRGGSLFEVRSLAKSADAGRGGCRLGQVRRQVPRTKATPKLVVHLVHDAAGGSRTAAHAVRATLFRAGRRMMRARRAVRGEAKNTRRSRRKLVSCGTMRARGQPRPFCAVPNDSSTHRRRFDAAGPHDEPRRIAPLLPPLLRAPTNSPDPHTCRLRRHPTMPFWPV